jgi:hypothetical protein
MTFTKDFINKFDQFRRVPDTGNVIIHPDVPHGFIELKAKFVDELKNHLIKKTFLAHNSIDKLSPSDKFVIMLLEKAY